MACLKSLGKIFLMIPYTTHPVMREWGRLKNLKMHKSLSDSFEVSERTLQ